MAAWSRRICHLPLREILTPPDEGFRPSSSRPSPPCELSDALHDAHLWGKHMFTISMIPWDGLLEVIILTGGTQTCGPYWSRDVSKIWALFLILLLQEKSDTICLKQKYNHLDMVCVWISQMGSLIERQKQIGHNISNSEQLLKGKVHRLLFCFVLLFKRRVNIQRISLS